MTDTINSSVICVDASFVLRMALGGPHRQAVRNGWDQWLDQGMTLIAPPLFAFEVTSVVWQYVYQQRLTSDRGKRIFLNIFQLGIKLEYPLTLHKAAWQLPHEFNLSQAYDAHYLALAQHFNCEFWTVDMRLYNTLHSKLPWVRTVSGAAAG